jgi:adenosylmethionine-8-amino-7-oxononanoate aminotransferase
MTGRYQHFITPTGSIGFPKVSHGDGVYIWDDKGNRLLDGSSGNVSVNVGHSHPRVLEAMREQMSKITFANARLWENEAHELLAERLERLSDWGFSASFLVSGGSEANESAIKIARQVAVARGQSSRWKFISRLPSYHGATTALLGITGDPEYAAAYKPMFVDMPKVDAPFTYRLPEGVTAEAHDEHCAQQLEETILREGPDTVLAFMIEPVGGVSTGALVSSHHYYRRVREICDRYGVFIIYDEIMSGAGRTGKFLAAHHWRDSRPDIVSLAKGVSGAYAPLGAVMVSDDMLQDMRNTGGFKHGHTYSANPVSCAASNAVLAVVEDERLMENAITTGALLREKLEALKASTRTVGDVRGLGLHLAVEIVRDQEKKTPYDAKMRAAERLCALCREQGLLIFSRRTAGGKYGEWLMATPPLTITPAQVDEMVGSLARAIRVLEAEFHPKHD